MGVVSHSQVGEDLQIAYFLGDPRNVTYIDVGCLWPKQHSNSYFFYERGGHGLCIDANPTVADQWSKERPRDVFLNAGLGAQPRRLTYHTFANPVFNTFSQERADRVRRRGKTKPGREPAGSVELEITTLNDAVRLSGLPERCEGRLDFLSIDVEGLEEEVLAGFGFDVLRPRLVVCELIRRRGDGDHPEDSSLARHLADRGYAVGGYTGHDVYFVDAMGSG